MPSLEVSVIVPTYQRSELLRQCIESFDDQTRAPTFEVVVVDDGSTDGTAELLRGLASSRPWLQFSRLPANAGPAAARNAAVATATGDLVLFIDDDVVASPDLLRRHVDLHNAAEDDNLAILGRVAWHPSLTVTPFMKWLDYSGLQFAYDTWLKEGNVEIPASAFYTANLSMRRQLVVAAGGFDERFPFPAYEDIELATRLTERGLRMFYRPIALAYHSRPIDRHTFARRMMQVGESAELMRTIAPDFLIDDVRLRRRKVSRREELMTAMTAKARRSEENLWAYYWATIAAAYDEGIRCAVRSGDGAS